jgi:hypothetical protein
MLTGRSQTTFVCCIESGPLEPMALRLVESIRRHGGEFAGARIIACQPRFGAPLSSSTRSRLAELNAEHVWLWKPRRRGWYHYLNKAEALVYLEPQITTEWVTFLDSDMVVASEPTAIVGDDVDFVACAPDDGLVGSTGPSHRLDPTWTRYFSSVGLKIDDVPMIKEYNTGKYIRLYFNSGLFSYRISTGFGKFYKSSVEKALSEHLGFPYHYEHFTDQIVLGLAAYRMGLRWRELPYGYNLAVDRDASELPDEKMREAVVLHYHKALEKRPDVFFKRLSVTHPQLHEWLPSLGGVSDSRSAVSKIAGEALRIVRGVPRRLYRQRVRLAPGDPSQAESAPGV